MNIYKATIICVLAFLWMLWGVTQAVAQNSLNFRTLKGAEANQFVLPDDVNLVRSFHLDAYGLTYERYQQYYGDAKVLGGQLTLYWNDAGELETVIGAHHPNIVPKNSVSLSKADAERIAKGDIGQGGRRIVDLMIDPATGRHFYRVETRRLTSRWIHWVGAQSGRVINKFDALTNECNGGVMAPCGHGAHYGTDGTDVKDLSAANPLQKALTSGMSLKTETHVTHDQGSTNKPFAGPIATDGDREWTLSGRTSPGQGALVDAHYYASIAHDFYQTEYTFPWPNGVLPIEIQAHFFKDYVNAFWNGDMLAFGDGDGASYTELTSLDVVGHELTHAVTEFTSNLIYSGESGALNEAFSDIMGNTMEFYADNHSLETFGQPDWLVGEDFDQRSSEIAKGFRNMEYPEEDGDPSHYDNRYTGTSDNGGVHINSGIPNHAYYLLVNGESDCTNISNNAHAHCAAEGTNLNGLGLDRAHEIFFLGFTVLNENANMCDARDSTVVVAGASDQAVKDAWEAVGVTAALCGGGNITDYPPAVSIENPADGQNFPEGTTSVLIQATATDDNSVQSVEFFLNGGRIGFGTKNGDQWSISLNNLSDSSSYSVQATATDSIGQSTVSDTVDFTVGVLTCVPAGGFCSSNSVCCSNSCKGKPGRGLCK
jgi:Zn-dependent metalloprotease